MMLCNALGGSPLIVHLPEKLSETLRQKKKADADPVPKSDVCPRRIAD